jgi:F0F1-type ATP synthase assembly protein I
MEPSSRSSFDPAGAGAIIVSGTGAGVGIGILVGWAAGSITWGGIIGAILGLPAGVYAVYRRYRGAFS